MIRHILPLFVTVLAALDASAQVTYERIRNAESEPASWLTYSGSYRSHRFSTLDQISRENVANLRTAWVYQIRQAGIVETSPIVADGIMYVTEPPSTVTALDVRTGRPLWSYLPTIPKDVIIIGSPPVNRGVAVLNDSVFVGTVDGRLIALDSKSGAVRWETVVGDNKSGYYLTLAPLALDGRIIVGVSGAETGIRGYIDAYDWKTGQRLWRRWTIPAPGEPGARTWGGNSWKTGGGSTWLTGSFDPELNLLYWGIGNPAPDWNGDNRPGDNLYTCSLLALDPTDGTIRWHFQFTPHDVHDWDANQIPVLFDDVIEGRKRRMVAMANRNGFYYVLDRENGEFITGMAYAKQTWAKGLDSRGRPIVIPGSEPTVKGTLTWPSLQGAANWYSPSYSPQTKLFYHATREMGSYYFKGEAGEDIYRPGEAFVGGGERALSGDDASGAVRALDSTTGKLKWEFKLHSPPWAGLLSTAGGLVFGGTDEGNFFALDAEGGTPLWDVQLGGAVRANPITFAIDGTQHVAIAAGYGIFVFALPTSPPAAAPAADDPEVRALVGDYIGLYTRETLLEWRKLFLPTFTATFTNDDGSTTTRGLDDFYVRQEKFFATGRSIREELSNVVTERRGRLGSAHADFTLINEGTRRNGRLMLLFVQEHGRLRIQSLIFTYHLE